MSHPPHDNEDTLSKTNQDDLNATEASATTDATDDRVRNARFLENDPHQMTERGANEDVEATVQPSQHKTSALSKLTNYMRGNGTERADSDFHSRDRGDSDATLVGSIYKGSKSTVKTVHKSSKTTVKTVHKAVDKTKRTHDTKTDRSRVLTKFQEGEDACEKFLLKLADALQGFGCPSHRIESQLASAAEHLGLNADIVNLYTVIMIIFFKDNEGNHLDPDKSDDRNLKEARIQFVRVNGKNSLTKLHQVHDLYRAVCRGDVSLAHASAKLAQIKRTKPLYSLYFRCVFAFFQGSLICVIAFGGSIFDMWISGVCAAALQYLGLNSANKSTIYASVYEISVSILVAFIARALSAIPGNIFCYSAISSAGTVVILPGFTVLISALDLMSRNFFCGAVRMVYAIIYTLFLGFGLTLGSDAYLAIDKDAQKRYLESGDAVNVTLTHGKFQFVNGTNPFVATTGTLGEGVRSFEQQNLVNGCFRDPSWPWPRQSWPWYSAFVTVPLYSFFSSLSNGQAAWSKELPIMIFFSSCSYAANKAAGLVLPQRADLVSAAGALTIGLLGNLYSRIIRGTAYTAMVTGVLFLVPSGIAQGGGLTPNFKSSAEQYANGFGLAIRMVEVASGVTIGLLLSQLFVYYWGYRKRAAHLAF